MATVISAERRPGDVKLAIKNNMLMIEETYHFRVDSDDLGDTRADVLNTPGLPIPNSLTHGISPSGMGVCKTVSAKREPRNAYIWWVTATYSSEVQDNTNGDNGNLNPLEWPSVINNVYLDPQEEVSLKDRDGKAYVNGAGVLIQDPPSQRYDLVRRDFFQFEPVVEPIENPPPGTPTERTIPLQDVISRNNTTNREEYLGVKKDKLLLTIRGLKEAIYYGQKLRLVEYSLTYNKNGWVDRIANTGDRFVYRGKVYPYRYRSDPNTVVEGPLGIRDVTLGNELDWRDALPYGYGEFNETSAVEVVGGEVYARPPSTREFLGIAFLEPQYRITPNPTVMHFIERRRFDSLNFADFLKVEDDGEAS